MTKKIYLSKDDKIIFGVCGGIAKAYDIDALWPRLIAVLLALYGGIGIILYIVAWIIIPEQPKEKKNQKRIVKPKKSNKK
jgi:phage shock protein PspC (stress-responsive transcriptional regulator)